MSYYGLDDFGSVEIGEHAYWFKDANSLPASLKSGDYKITMPKTKEQPHE
jgi:hypothetical protein